MKVNATNNIEALGFSQEEIDQMVSDAETGVGFPDKLENPIAEFLLALPQETRAAIVVEAERCDKTIAEVLVQAVTDHFAA